MAVVSDLVGLPDQGRAKMLEWAVAIWDVQGPADERFASAMPVVEEFMAFAAHEAVPGRIDPDGWAAHLYQAADRGELPREKCPVMMLDYITPSLDTTILAITNTIALFAEHPDQWELLRADRSLIPTRSTSHCAWSAQSRSSAGSSPRTTRSTACRCQPAAGWRCSTARPTATSATTRTRPDSTSPAAPRTIWPSGRGEHVCVGMHLARLEMTALLERLADRVTPVRHRRLHPNDQQRPCAARTPRGHRAHRRGPVTDGRKDGGWGRRASIPVNPNMSSIGATHRELHTRPHVPS